MEEKDYSPEPVATFKDIERVGYSRVLSTDIVGSGAFARALARRQRLTRFHQEADDYISILSRFLVLLNQADAHISEAQSETIINDFGKLSDVQYANPYAFTYAWLVKYDRLPWNTLRRLLDVVEPAVSPADILRYLKFYV